MFSVCRTSSCSAEVGGGEHGEAAGERPLPPHHLQVFLAAAHLDSGNQAFIAKFVRDAPEKKCSFNLGNS